MNHPFTRHQLQDLQNKIDFELPQLEQYRERLTDAIEALSGVVSPSPFFKRKLSDTVQNKARLLRFQAREWLRHLCYAIDNLSATDSFAAAVVNDAANKVAGKPYEDCQDIEDAENTLKFMTEMHSEIDIILKQFDAISKELA